MLMITITVYIRTGLVIFNKLPSYEIWRTPTKQYSINLWYLKYRQVVKSEACSCRNGETASCTIVFILVYYFMMAGAVWFVMLAFAWYLTFRALGTQRDDLKNKTSYFHIASWCVPLVLTIVCLSVSEVGFVVVSWCCYVLLITFNYDNINIS